MCGNNGNIPLIMFEQEEKINPIKDLLEPLSRGKKLKIPISDSNIEEGKKVTSNRVESLLEL